MRPRLAAAISICLVVGIGVSGCGGSSRSNLRPGPGAASVPGLGINAWYLFWEMPPQTWATQLAAMAQDNVKIARADAFWSSAEPRAPVAGIHHYDWGSTDAIAGSLAEHGIQWLPIADYDATWAESVPGDDRSPPSQPADYAAYAAALVARYGPGGSFWKLYPRLKPEPIRAVEVWNEPNATGSEIPPAEYATLYEAARTAIHAVDPSVEAIVGGLVNPAATYFAQLSGRLPGSHRIDAVADHPYDVTAAATIADVVALRAAMVARGDAEVPIDVTEFGWPTRGAASFTTTLTDEERAIALSEVIETLARSDCGVERILPYAWRTADQNSLDANDWFGLTTPDSDSTASTLALRHLYARLQGEKWGGPASISLCGRPR